MKRTAPAFFLLALLALVFSMSGRASAQTASPTVPPVTDDEVVKITTKLVQIDLLVVDKDGKQVRDLSASDFELLQDGKPQKITNFSYVDTETGQRTVKAPPAPQRQTPNRNIPTPPPVRSNSQNVGRVLTFIVDDGNCDVSLIGMTAAREGLQKFIREQMLPDDRIAIYQTRNGSSVFQQYTNDKERLLKIAGKIKWLPPGGSCSTTDGSFTTAAKANTFSRTTSEGTSSRTIESPEERAKREAAEDYNRTTQITGTLGVFSYVIKGLERVSGRKLVFILSDGLPLRSRTGANLNSTDVLRDLTDLANRASVVVNTIDVRGVGDPTMIEARDEVLTKRDVNATNPIIGDREKADRNRKDGMEYLARETGGKFYAGQNYLETPIKQALGLEKGYYLLAYDPGDSAFRGKNFNNIEVRVNRPGLRVISRAGFLGFANAPAKQRRKTGDSELYEAIAAPLAEAGLNVRLTAYFANSAAEGNVVRSLFHLDGSDLTFADAPGGQKKIVLDVVAVTLSEKNEVIDEFTRSHTLKFDAAGAAVIARDGLVYAADVPVKKPGTYNFRVAVRDATSQTLGSSSQIIQIPDLKKNSLFVSGLTISGVDAAGNFQIPGATKVEDALTVAGSLAVPAIRRFKRGSIVAYAYTIYNARLDKTTNRPKLTTQMNLYRDGQLVVEGPIQNADIKPQSDHSRIHDFAYVKLVDALTAGDYALQIVVSDELGGKNAVSSQWVDFELVD